MGTETADGCGLVHLYCGDGKGKTSAATGLAVRARGAGLRVGFFQFMKASPSCEVAMLEKLGVVTANAGGSGKFVFQMNDDEKSSYSEQQCDLLTSAAEAAEEFDLLVLDELASAIGTGMIPEKMATDFLDNKPERLEVAITGRDPAECLQKRAAYISDIHCLRHPYEKGVAARKGIEF